MPWGSKMSPLPKSRAERAIFKTPTQAELERRSPECYPADAPLSSQLLAGLRDVGA